MPGTGTAVRGQFRHLTLRFANGLTNGQSLRFGADRDLALSPFHDTSEGNGADELADGQTFRAAMTNRIGHGYSPIDGFGLVNAQRAVFGP